MESEHGKVLVRGICLDETNADRELIVEGESKETCSNSVNGKLIELIEVVSLEENETKTNVDGKLVVGGGSQETIANRKLFVGGVSRETTSATLKEHFSKYGEVREYEIIKDKYTGNGRGFGFVSFTDPSVVGEVLQDYHIILGRMVEVKIAMPKSDRLQGQEPNHLQQQQSNRSSRNKCKCTCNCNNHSNIESKNKIFVGGLPPSLTKKDLRRHFETFGTITDVVLIHNKENNRPRGFGFVVFDSEEAVNNVLQKNFYKLNSKIVEVKRAKHKDMIDGPICTYDCYNTGLGFGWGPPYGNFGFYSPCNTPSYESVSGYSYGANSFNHVLGAPFVVYNGVGYENSLVASSSYDQSPICYASTVSHPSYINNGAYGHGWSGELMDMNNGAYGCGWSSGLIDMNNGAYGLGWSSMDMTHIDDNYHRTPTTYVTSSNSRDSDDGCEVEALASTRFLQIGDGSNLEDNGAKYQNRQREIL